jgi:large subunit ribosomal protein L3
MPITVLKAWPMVVTQVKNEDKDGYNSVQVGSLRQKKNRLNNPQKGHLKTIKTKTPPVYLREVSIKEESQLKVGDEVTVDMVLKPGDKVKVRGISRGKGFTGVMSRWGFSGGPRTHGQSDRERAPGSIGQGTDPGRVHRGKKMPGRHGGAKVTVLNLTVVKVDPLDHELWLSGAIPGSINSLIEVSPIGENRRFKGLAGMEEEKAEPEQEVLKESEVGVKEEKESEDK